MIANNVICGCSKAGTEACNTCSVLHPDLINEVTVTGIKKQKPNIKFKPLVIKNGIASGGNVVKQKTNNSTDWESRFDEVILDICENDLSEDWLMDRSVNKLKSFISSELQRERENSFKNGYETSVKELTPIWENVVKDERKRVLEEVEGIIGPDEKHSKWIICSRPEEPCYVCDRNEFRHELLSKIKELK